MILLQGLLGLCMIMLYIQGCSSEFQLGTAKHRLGTAKCINTGVKIPLSILLDGMSPPVFKNVIFGPLHFKHWDSKAVPAAP